MAKRSGFAANLGSSVQRDLARAQAAGVRAQAAAQREADRARRAYERAVASDEKERKRLYLEARAAEVDAQNESLDSAVRELETLLTATLSVDDHIDFESLKQRPQLRPFDPGALAHEERVPDPKWFAVSPLSASRRLLPGTKARHDADVAAAQRRYEDACQHHALRRERRLDAWRRAYDEHNSRNAQLVGQAQQHNAQIDSFRRDFEARDPDAVVSYFGLVLQASVYPETFPQRYRLAYIPESKQLVLEHQMPDLGVIPTVKAYKYLKTKDEVTATARPATQIRALYTSLVAQIALRTLHEIIEADRLGLAETIVYNGFVDTVNSATGRGIKPTLVSVRTSRDTFLELDLARVEATACLRHLGASFSKSPSELAPVRPVLEFDMVDKRFVSETDVLSGLDQRPNLMDLTPSEFESLITNLFTKMGLETRLTQASRDGGVDCVAYDQRPVIGGKVVIQAKRYKGTVGVSAVRDLFGTVHNEGASKGILVTTSGYGKASFEFANGKPLELIDGGGLLYLLAEHAGVEARIVPPEDWIDPAEAVLS